MAEAGLSTLQRSARMTIRISDSLNDKAMRKDHGGRRNLTMSAMNRQVVDIANTTDFIGNTSQLPRRRRPGAVCIIAQVTLKPMSRESANKGSTQLPRLRWQFT